MSTSTATTGAARVAASRSTYSLVRNLALCVVLSVLNVVVVAKLSGVLYRATSQHPLEQTGVALLFAALLGSLARVWFIALSNRPSH
jgi:hypothetical protein